MNEKCHIGSFRRYFNIFIQNMDEISIEAQMHTQHSTSIMSPPNAALLLERKARKVQ